MDININELHSAPLSTDVLKLNNSTLSRKTELENDKQEKEALTKRLFYYFNNRFLSSRNSHPSYFYTITTDEISNISNAFEVCKQVSQAFKNEGYIVKVYYYRPTNHGKIAEITIRY
jgi:hypothetical protein